MSRQVCIGIKNSKGPGFQVCSREGNRLTSKPRVPNDRVLSVLTVLLLICPCLTARPDLIEPAGARGDTFAAPMKWDSRIRPHIGFRLYLEYGNGPTTHILRQPGEYSLPLNEQHGCPGSRVQVEVEETSRPDWLRSLPPDESRSRIPANKASSSSVKQGMQVVFDATLRGVRGSTSAGLLFETQRGAICLIENRRGYAAQLIRAAAPGHRLMIKGTVQTQSRIAVEDIQFLSGDRVFPLRNRVWLVRVGSSAGKTRLLYRPGLYRFAIPVGDKKVNCRAHLQEVKLARLSIGGHELTAEVADTPAARYYGLQGRSSLPKETGMLFVFARPQIPEFVMKSVSFPISTAFFTGHGRLTNVRQMDPDDQTPARPPVPVRYVLETRQGWFRKRGLGPGARLQFTGNKKE